MACCQPLIQLECLGRLFCFDARVFGMNVIDKVLLRHLFSHLQGITAHVKCMTRVKINTDHLTDRLSNDELFYDYGPKYWDDFQSNVANAMTLCSMYGFLPPRYSDLIPLIFKNFGKTGGQKLVTQTGYLPSRPPPGKPLIMTIFPHLITPPVQTSCRQPLCSLPRRLVLNDFRNNSKLLSANLDLQFSQQDTACFRRLQKKIQINVSGT